jgi:Uma2 family endonuclease
MSALTSSVAPNFLNHYSVPPDTVYRLTIEQYHEMIEKGILSEGDPVELLEGWLITKMTKNPPHCVSVDLTRESIDRQLPSGWFSKSQDPITTDTSEPEPDITVVRGKRRDYLDRHPSPKDVGMLVEVSEDSLKRDRTTKKRVYAAAAIAIYWIVNLIDRQVEVYTIPSGPETKPDYAQRQDYKEGDAIPFILDGNQIGHVSVSDILP